MTNHIAEQFGNYRLVRHLGRGAFSDVYLGIHVHLKTPAAIKLLHTELTSGDVEKFRNEARTIARLEHPHIVRVLDFGIEDHTPFFVMVYAPNGTLRQRHPKGSILSLATIVSYVTQIAGALQFAHNQKFIHRDIKPENMLLGGHNEVLLSDFGFVQIAQSSISQSTKEMAGTIPYMAPEQFHGRPRFASDQYSLGIVVYEWLTGDRPFQGSVLEIATQHMMNPPPPVRVKNPTVPLEVEEVLLTTLAKDPQQRFATVQAFANALQQASNIVYPIASTSTISFEEVSDLPSIGTQPISIGMTPPVLIHNNPPAFQTDTIEDSYSNISSSILQKSTNEPVVSTTHSQHRLSRRAILFGLAGVAVGSVVSNGIWIAKSTGLIHEDTITTSRPPITALYTYPGHKGPVLTTAWSPDGYRIASGGYDTTVQVWGAFAGWPSFTYPFHKDDVWSVAWSPDSTMIASAGGSYDKSVRVWDAISGKTILILNDYTDGVNSVVWSPNGKFIATGGYDKLVQIRDPFNQSPPIITLAGHTNAVKSVAWSPGGKYIASASLDQRVIVWDANTGNPVYSLQHKNYVKSVAWSPKSRFIVSATGDTTSGGSGEHLVYMWDATTKKLLRTYNGHTDGVATVAWSPVGNRIASAGGNIKTGDGDTSVQVWEAFSGTKVLTYAGHHKMVNSVAWSPTGLYIASASRDMTVQVWKAE
ncbi:MAG: protein kinase domain-containing protein [Ktedonobacteraceae bacterium]